MRSSSRFDDAERCVSRDSTCEPETLEEQMTEPTLYDRLGGYNAIAMVVDRFSDADHREP